jgi:hypothetical protein
MRTLSAALLILLGMAAGADASAPRKGAKAVSPPAAAAAGQRFASQEQLLKWIDQYREEPAPDRLPAAVRAMSDLGLLRDPDAAGVYVGFVAGVLADNQMQAETLVTRMFPLPPEDQGLVIRAVAWSGLPDWKGLLRRLVERMPARRVLIDRYLTDKEKLLLAVPLDSGPAAIDTLWGFYFATGSFEPVKRILAALPWSGKSETDVEKLTIGSMAKWTLANNAQRDKALLDLLRIEIALQQKAVAEPLREVVEAAQAYETHKIRKEALAAIDNLKRNGPPKTTSWKTWAARAGETAIAVGCVAAGALGQAQIGLPCIVTGAAVTGIKNMLSSP